MSDRTYDAFGGRFILPIMGGIMVGTDTFNPGAVAIDGTASALAAQANTKVVIPFASKLVSGSRINSLGSTNAVALMSAVICKSAAGTGSLSAVGTFVFNGTAATGATGSAAIVDESVSFAAGDQVSISEAIGTIAGIATHQFWLGFEELYN